MFNKEKVNILYIEGSHDGYYYDLHVQFKYENEKYDLVHAGSYSGWIPYFLGITKNNFERLYGKGDKYAFEGENCLNDFLKKPYDDWTEEGIFDLIERALTELGDNEYWEESEEE